ncbi:MAG: MFS transporter [Candidatus Komeilibacteria bacterium]|nr:MFS transporter [Candidatus Komeilibacteria bacterium]
MKSKKLVLWSLYDFANSIVFINFLVYFSQWLVIDGGLSDWWFNATFAISSILLFLSAPTLAAITDRKGHRKFFLNISTVALAMCYSIAALLAHAGSGIILIAIFFLLGQYFYQLSFVFYNPMIDEIADINHRARVSGIGQFANAIGQVVGLAIMLPLASSRLAPLLPSVAIFILLALPMMIFFPKNTSKNSKLELSDVSKEGRGSIKKFVAFFSLSLSAPLLLAFFFYNDALVTVTNNYSIYMQRVFDISDSKKSIILMVILLMNAIGAIISGWLGDRLGIFRTLKFTLIGWIIALPIIAIAPNVGIFIAITALMGILIGSMWATSRAYMSTLLTSGEMGYGFSFYTLLERFATFAGPLTWGGIIALLGTESSSYRIAMASMSAFVVIGLLLILLWKRKPVYQTPANGNSTPLDPEVL